MERCWVANERLQLIREVELREEIWDGAHPDHNNRPRIEALWKEISETMGEVHSLDEIRKQWKNLRDSFLKQKRRLDPETSGELTVGVAKWKFFEDLLFLTPEFRTAYLSANSPNTSILLGLPGFSLFRSRKRSHSCNDNSKEVSENTEPQKATEVLNAAEAPQNDLNTAKIFDELVSIGVVKPREDPKTAKREEIFPSEFAWLERVVEFSLRYTHGIRPKLSDDISSELCAVLADNYRIVAKAQKKKARKAKEKTDVKAEAPKTIPECESTEVRVEEEGSPGTDKETVQEPMN